MSNPNQEKQNPLPPAAAVTLPVCSQSITPRCDAEATELVSLHFAKALERGATNALVAALDAGSKHCARLLKKYPGAPNSPTWLFVRDLLTDMRKAATSSSGTPRKNNIYGLNRTTTKRLRSSPAMCGVASGDVFGSL